MFRAPTPECEGPTIVVCSSTGFAQDFPVCRGGWKWEMPKLVLKHGTSPNTRYLVRCFFQLQTSIDEMGQLDVLPIPSWTWKTRCSPRTECSHVEHFCETSYWDSHVHFSPATVPVNCRLWNAEEGGVQRVECGV